MSTPKPSETRPALQHRRHAIGVNRLGPTGQQYALLQTLNTIEIHKRRRKLKNRTLEQMLGFFFEDTVVDAYSYGLCVGKTGGSPEHPGHSLSVMPLDEALLAAHRAVGFISDQGDEDDQESVYVAALMHPCAEFVMHLPEIVQDHANDPRPYREQWALRRRYALERPLSYLRQSDERLWMKLRYLLAQDASGLVVPASWLPLRQAVLRSQARIKALW